MQYYFLEVKNGGIKMSRTAICSVCGEFLVDSYGDEFTNAKVIDLYGREFVIVICKGCLEELLRKCEEQQYEI
ncbi:TPA: hypothetical protein KPG44_000671 [Clostridioides difficile]|nr:hypothetical protein [Clostridioides difficile]MBY1216457.1 hypothetical protein [Clostridioides difficile]MBZ1029660.1 hypothetical protein [Clostridioides difficile]VHX62573.1 Uncharacterised protein [Clostridioides difficile]VIB75409.1 Uncharacterised protein [Clostridioides difficile]